MNSRYKDKLVGIYAPSSYGHTSVLGQTQEFSRWFWENRYYDNMEDSVHVFNDKNDAINELHRLRLEYRNARKYKVEMVECDG